MSNYTGPGFKPAQAIAYAQELTRELRAAGYTEQVFIAARRAYVQELYKTQTMKDIAQRLSVSAAEVEQILAGGD